MRVLFISPYVPSPIRIRPFYWVRNLARLGHDVSLFALASGSDDARAIDGVRPYCSHLTVTPRPAWRPLWNALRAWPRDEPYQLAWSRLPALARAIRQAADHGADVAHVEHLRAACFAPAVAPLPVVFDAVDSIGLLFERTRQSGPRFSDRRMASLDLARTRRFEAGMASTFDRVLVTSHEDARHLSAEWTAEEERSRLVVLPNPVSRERFHSESTPREPATLIVTGKMSYHANVAAATRLVRHVMPLVWASRADVRVLLVGSRPPRAVRVLAGDRVTVTGWVPDLNPWLARATLALCPTTYGVGIQNKVLEAMAAGVPVIASRRAGAALRAVPGRDYRAAETDADFAAAVLDLLHSPAEQRRLSEAALRYVAAEHDELTVTGRLDAVYRDVVRARSA